MPRPKELDIDLEAVDADGIVDSETLGAGGNFAIDGALASGGKVVFDYPRQLLQTAAGNESARTFTITGKDADGNTQTLAMAGLNATTGETAEYWSEVTQIASDDATAGAVSFGTVDEVSTQTIPLDFYSDTGATISVDVTGTINYTVQETFDSVLDLASPTVNATWANITALASKTADITATATVNATAVRLLVNSYTAGAELQMRVIQSRYR
jgi:hypothetical protein